MGPVQLAPLAGALSYFLVFLVLGMAFGAVLEMSGFGDSRRLSAQFYLRDMTVLKVMFTGIIVAAVLVHLASALQLLDLSKVWINPTYLVPGIVGGLIMGVGFIVGGFCPGTSLVAASTLKLDGIFFVLGGLFGALAFGETVHSFSRWWHSTAWGRLTLYDAMHVPAGWVVLGLVVMALGVFVFAEQVERNFGAGRPEIESEGAKRGLSFGVPSLGRPAGRVFAFVLVALAAVTAIVGQPGTADRWRWIAPQAGPLLEKREVLVDPVEVVELRRDLAITVRVLEVRTESDYNRFHLAGSQRISPEDCESAALVRELTAVPDHTILFLVGNGERAAIDAWKKLRAQGVINLYVVEGGINRWLELFPLAPAIATRRAASPDDPDALAWEFTLATGASLPSARPEVFEPSHGATHAEAAVTTAGFDGSQMPSHAFTKKVKLQKKVVAKGGCG